MNRLHPQSVWPMPRTVFMAGRYCEHELPYLKLETIDEEEPDFIVLGLDDLEKSFHHCLPKKFLTNFEMVHEKVQEVGNRLEHGMAYQPFLLELCVVKIDSVWYRCKMLGKDEAGILVYTIDYGVICSVPEENIRVRYY